MKQFTVKESDRILIIAPHPDDESIGCGGLISLYPSQCDIVVMTDGSLGDTAVIPSEMKEIRKKEFLNAMSLLKIGHSKMMNYSDGELINYPACMDDIRFDLYSKVLVPYFKETHSDHIATYKSAVEAINRLDHTTVELWQYETRGATCDESFYLDISEVIENKLKLISCYKSQVSLYDYVSFSKSLASYHACKKGAAGRYFEAFIPVTGKENSDNDAGVLADLRRKNEILEKWMSLKVSGIELADYLLPRYKSIAVYGCGYFGKMLSADLEQSGIEIAFFVDRNKKSDESGITIVAPKDAVSADVLIISNMNGADSIKEEMNNKNYKDVMTLWELLIKAGTTNQ
ncbi:PIG-L deacetylase family protein [Butyrivibrio fibrisolvens]|nr:PIG-L deacetylase family protein [Butyrivibrio fibrisolvens]